MTADPRPRVLIFVVAYHAESTILDVLERIPALPDYEAEVLVIDDSSSDATYALSEKLRRLGNYRHPLTVLANPVNQGYGGNQKVGYHYAIKNGFDIVALVHGDGQYAPEILPEILQPIANGRADVVLGSRMMVAKNALKGGMPLYKFVGNKVLTWYQNLVLGSSLSEFHTGYRAYSVDLLRRRIPFDLNSNAFHFDTEILIQLLRARARIVEIPISTFYGNEVCRVPGFRYAKDVFIASTVGMLQDYGFVYRRNFDVEAGTPDNRDEQQELGFLSPHSAALEEVRPDATVLDIGSSSGPLLKALQARNCRVIGVELNTDPFATDPGSVDVILLLDVIEHQQSPEKFCQELRRFAQRNLGAKIIISTGNIGFFVTRLMLFLGQFNYTKRGILDLTHTRLFTRSSLRRLLEETGFAVEKEKGIPFPVPLYFHNRGWSLWLMKIQLFLIRISRGLFAYQIFAVARALPTPEILLADAHRHADIKASLLTTEVEKP
jgi:glycosyltransferase involved in cell wall biosynthesis/2-polyprenyl-3-methyl-5-hydroxy-6-metoxy-1,4-benzoquinol methylase